MEHGPAPSGSLSARERYFRIARRPSLAHQRDPLKGLDMSQVSPFHSVKQYARNVYHDNDRCTEGNNIESYYRRSGTGGRPRCEHCSRLA